MTGSSDPHWSEWHVALAIKRDYYEVLGVTRDCSPEELKRTFRKLAMELHPDRNPDNAEAETRFKEAAEAYQILSDPDRRRSYGCIKLPPTGTRTMLHGSSVLFS